MWSERVCAGIDTITSGTGLEVEVKFNRNCIGPAVTMRVAGVARSVL